MATRGHGFNERAFAVMRRIPAGFVLTYGDVAALAGSPGAARAVGTALYGLPEGTDVPWWRVVNRDGGISYRAGGGPALQRQILAREGIAFAADGRLSLGRYRWLPR